MTHERALCVCRQRLRRSQDSLRFSLCTYPYSFCGAAPWRCVLVSVFPELLCCLIQHTWLCPGQSQPAAASCCVKWPHQNRAVSLASCSLGESRAVRSLFRNKTTHPFLLLQQALSTLCSSFVPEHMQSALLRPSTTGWAPIRSRQRRRRDRSCEAVLVPKRQPARSCLPDTEKSLLCAECRARRCSRHITECGYVCLSGSQPTVDFLTLEKLAHC